MAIKSFLEAIRDAQFEEMQRDDNVFIMGEDVRCNLFGTFSGITEAFGDERLRDTPIAEAGICGVAAGAAMVGMRPICDITVAAFLYPAMDQIVSIIAKSRYLYGGQAKVPLVIRSNLIYGNGNAAQHSDRPHSMFMSIPGLRIVLPSNPYEAKGLLKTAIRSDDPVLVFEDALLWSSKCEVPEEEYLIPFGQANVSRKGSDVTIVGIGAMMMHANAAADELAKQGVSAEVIDPRTLAPLDMPTILQSVAKTGRLVVVDSGWESCSAASEIAATVAQQGFWDLRAPIQRVATQNTHIPFSPSLEGQLYASPEKVVAAALATFD